MNIPPRNVLFPFLSVLLGTMGVLAFLSIALAFFEQLPEAAGRTETVLVRWHGAPEHVRPLLFACERDELVLHGTDGTNLRFSLADLQREAALVRSLRERMRRRLGEFTSSQRLWLQMKQELPRQARLHGGFTLFAHALELNNLRGAARQVGEEHYPILLIYPQGLRVYEHVAYLLEATTQLPVGLEPMQPNWRLPYQDLSLGTGMEFPLRFQHSAASPAATP